MKYYNRENSCEECGINFDKIGWKHPQREYNREGDWTGRWLCKNCYYKLDYRHRDNTQAKLFKSLADRRTGNLIDSDNIFGDNVEELTSRWLKAERLSIKYDKFAGLPLDHSPIPDGVKIQIRGRMVDLSGKIFQTKGRRLRLTKDFRECWGISHLDNEWIKEFDYLIFYCASEDGKVIERIYIIPKQELYDPETGHKKNGITIYKYQLRNSKTLYWYEKYRVICKDVNNIWQEIIK
jgi:hypothetical protein